MQVGICDLKSENFEQDFLQSVINTGFAVLINHNIEYALIKDAQQKWKEFYKKEQIYKNLFINGNNTNMGYKGLGTETAVGSKIADLKEFFHWHPGEELPESTFDPTVSLYYHLEDLGMKMLAVLQKKTHANYVWECNDSKNTLLRMLYYPALKNFKNSEGAVRAAAHEDINHITLLVAASAPGLQVQDRDGKWYDVPHEENSICLNIGDMLQLQSRGLFKSTTHRVINPPDNNSDRVSMPLFIHPHGSTILAPGVTAAQFLQERIDKIYGRK